MKKSITTCIVLFVTTCCSWAATISIGISGSFFTNYYAFAQVGDVLEFTLVSPHTATRVSMDNWNVNNGVPLSGGFNFTTPGVHQYTVTSEDIDGIFYVCTVHVNGGMKGQVLVSEPTSLFDKALMEELVAYPNPTTGMITLENNEPSQVKVYDQYGVLVKDVYINPKGQLDLSALTNGVYFISVVNGNKRERSGRVIKK